MATYISILRGINVSGYKKILMADLKALYEGLHFEDVKTYIQSGNVVFKTASKASNLNLAKQIEEVIADKYDFSVPVIVRSLKELENIQSNNPFLKNKDVNIEKLHVTFLAVAPQQPALENIRKFSYRPDEFVILDKEVFLHCPVNYGETKLSNRFFEDKLKVSATTRNWKTVNKLVEMASGA